MERERNKGTQYIIRFREGNEIKTLKVNDGQTLDYIIEKLEQEFINYVIIKQQDNCYKYILRDLLDYKIEGVD